MKAHIGVDAESGLTHTVMGTAAYASGVTQVGALRHDDEAEVSADAGYIGAEQRGENRELPVTWPVAMKRRVRKALPKNP